MHIIYTHTYTSGNLTRVRQGYEEKAVRYKRVSTEAGSDDGSLFVLITQL